MKRMLISLIEIINLVAIIIYFYFEIFGWNIGECRIWTTIFKYDRIGCISDE